MCAYCVAISSLLFIWAQSQVVFQISNTVMLSSYFNSTTAGTTVRSAIKRLREMAEV